MRTILLTLMLTPALLPGLAQAAPPTPVTMTAFLDKSVYRVGQPIVLEVDLHNTRPRTVVLRGAPYERYSFKYVLLDSAGKSAPRTVRGKEMLRPPPEYYVNPPFAFGPRATRRYRINLAAYFQVSPGKTYTLRVTRTLNPPEGGEVSLTAGPFKFRTLDTAALPHGPATRFVDDPKAILNIP